MDLLQSRHNFPLLVLNSMDEPDGRKRVGYENCAGLANQVGSLLVKLNLRQPSSMVFLVTLSGLILSQWSFHHPDVFFRCRSKNLYKPTICLDKSWNGEIGITMVGFSPTHHAKIWMGLIFPIYVLKRFTSRFTHLKLSIFIVQPHFFSQTSSLKHPLENL